MHVSAATRRRRTPPPKKKLNPLVIVGPIVGLLIILVLVLIFKDSGGNGGGGSGSGTEPAVTKTESAAEKARKEQEEKERREQEAALQQMKQRQDLQKRAGKCRTANELVNLAREAKRYDLEDMAEQFYLKALQMDQDHAAAHKGLDHTKFECSRDLKDFDYFDFGGLGKELDEYRELEGQWLARPQFDEVVAKWNREYDGLMAQLDEMEGDIYEQKVRAYEKRLNNLPFFGDIARNDAYTVGRKNKPIALFIQAARDRQEGHGEAIENAYMHFLEALMKHVDEEFLSQFDYERREGFEAYIVWILNSGGEYVNHARDYGRTSGLSVSSRAHYHHGKRVAVTYLENPQGLVEEDLHSLAHEMIHYIQDAYAPYGIRGMSSFWLIEGMAEWLATFSPDSRLPLGPFYFQFKNTDRIRLFRSLIKKLDGEYPIPMNAMLDINDMIMLGPAIQAAIAEDERIASWGTKDEAQNLLMNWTYAFGYCMCRYLNREYKEEFREYIKADLNGDGGMDAFQRIFKIKDLNKFEKDLYDYYE